RIIIKDNSWSQNGDTDFSETYRKNARDAVSEPDLVAGLTEIPFYLYDSHTYTVWGKGKNHLAVSNTAVAPGSETDIVVDFDSSNGGKGLLIGDIITKPGETPIPGGFHDNEIGTVGIPPSHDLGLVYEHWFDIYDLADIFYDGVVNAGDVLVSLNNLGTGAPQP
ncbi:MAG: hypothetical protein U9M89_00630, partial [Patescibacteria group bacterium]|nr:hypothetical protein [Patescibacteria group bacterium]